MSALILWARGDSGSCGAGGQFGFGLDLHTNGTISFRRTEPLLWPVESSANSASGRRTRAVLCLGYPVACLGGEGGQGNVNHAGGRRAGVGLGCLERLGEPEPALYRGVADGWYAEISVLIEKMLAFLGILW